MQVQASGPGVEKTGVLVNQRADFTVNAKDAGKGPLKITAQVREVPLAFLSFSFCLASHAVSMVMCVFLSWGQNAEGLPVEVKVTSKGDGLYACSYTPASPVKHTLAITWGGLGIPKSPFRVSSRSRPLLPAPGGPAEPESLFKAERIKILKSDCAKTLQPRAEDAGMKPKKPLIIIVTYTMEKYSC